jgi:hypothetical protein
MVKYCDAKVFVKALKRHKHCIRKEHNKYAAHVPDLIGEKFGDLIVKKLVFQGGRWHAVVLQNGFLRTIRTWALLSGSTKGCAMGWYKKKDKFRYCPKCEKKQKSTNFQNKRKTGKQSWCKLCMLKKCKKWVTENRKQYLLVLQKSNLRRNHGIDWSFYEAELKKQKNRCAVCRVNKPGGQGRWGVDHDHRCCPTAGKSCGKCFRGLLCNRCNVALGMVGDSIKILKQMLKYLRRF